MIDISAHVISVLKPLEITVAFQELPINVTVPNQYITFLEIDTNPALEAGDVEEETKRLIQVNIWSKTNYHLIVEGTRKLLESKGFERTFEYDVPKQEGDSHFNKVLRFAFFDEY